MRGNDRMTNVNQISDARPCASPRARTSARRVAAATLLLLSASILGACEGDNLFDGNADDFQPVASISAPDVVVAGETVGIRIDGSSVSGIAQLSVSMRGIVARDTVIEVKETRNSVSALLPVTIPYALQGTQLLIQAQVIDNAGRFSNIAEKMVEAYGPPYVQILSAPVTVQPGQVVDIEVAATAIQNVDQIALKLSGGADKDTTISISPASQSVRRVVRVQIPMLVEDTILTVTATARDEAGNKGSAVDEVPFVISAPTVSMIVPANVQAGGMLNLEVRAQALRKVSQIRVALRGGFAPIDQTYNLSPQQANVTQYVSLKLPGNITDPNIQVSVEAIDRSGLIGSTVQTVAVPLDSPMTIDLLDAPATVLAGHFLDLRVLVDGPRPYKEIVVRWRGFAADVFEAAGIQPDTIVKLATPRSPATEDVRVETPCVAGAFVVNVTARDEADQLSPIATTVVTITEDGTCPTAGDTTDTTGSASLGIAAAPAVRASLPPVGSFGTRPALLASRPFQLRTVGRRRRANM